jgi:hypothetical protein
LNNFFKTTSDSNFLKIFKENETFLFDFWKIIKDLNIDEKNYKDLINFENFQNISIHYFNTEEIKELHILKLLKKKFILNNYEIKINKNINIKQILIEDLINDILLFFKNNLFLLLKNLNNLLDENKDNEKILINLLFFKILLNENNDNHYYIKILDEISKSNQNLIYIVKILFYSRLLKIFIFYLNKLIILLLKHFIIL